MGTGRHARMPATVGAMTRWHSEQVSEAELAW